MMQEPAGAGRPRPQGLHRQRLARAAHAALLARRLPRAAGRARTSTRPPARSSCSTMREQVSRLTKLATDLLDLSRLDSGAVEVEQRAGRPGGRRARRSCASSAAWPRATAAGWCWRARRAACRTAIGDEQRVQQIGRVLVDNAVRHNPEGTQVRVVVGADDGHVTLTVSDDGPGIDADSQRHLFERFWRGAAEQRHRAAGWAWRSPASWPSAWAARSPSHPARATPSFALRLPSDGWAATADVAKFSRRCRRSTSVTSRSPTTTR